MKKRKSENKLKNTRNKKEREKNVKQSILTKIDARIQWIFRNIPI